MEYATLVIDAPHAERMAELMAQAMNRHAAEGWRVLAVTPGTFALGINAIVTFERERRSAP